MNIVFYRILGNDIPVRHGPHQTPINLPFILENEPELAGCEKRFLLNRIVDARIRQSLISMIEREGLGWDEIPFEPDDFRKLDTVEEKALYLTNQNAARNRCIDLGLERSDLVLPFDGQVCFSAAGWSGLIDGLNANPSVKYYTVPMFRLRNNRHALGPKPKPDADHLWAEPQVVVRRGYDIRFDKRLSYGRANKIELLMRLGVAGPWDEWVGQQYVDIRASLATTRSQSFGQVTDAGFVFRLESGNWKADRNITFRVQARNAGLGDFVARIDNTLRA